MYKPRRVAKHQVAIVKTEKDRKKLKVEKEQEAEWAARSGEVTVRKMDPAEQEKVLRAVTSRRRDWVRGQ